MLWILGLLVLNFLILIHELGHYFAMRYCGVPILKFSVGIGPKVLGFNWRGTRFQLSLLPLGGYVVPTSKSAIEMLTTPEHYDELKEKYPELLEESRWFENRGGLVRLFGIMAGPGANIAYALCASFLLFSFAPKIPLPGPIRIESISVDSVSYASGLREGDTFVSYNRKEIGNLFDALMAVELVKTSSGENEVVVKNLLGEEKTLIVKGRLEGVKFEPSRVSLNPTTTETLECSLHFMKMLFDAHLYGASELMTLKTGKDPTPSAEETDNIQSNEVQALEQREEQEESEDKDSSSVSGPLGMVKSAGKMSEEGLISTILVSVIFSCSIAFFNLIPFPPLDGFKIVKITIETMIGRQAPAILETFFMLLGVVFLLGLLVIGTWNDLVN